MRERGSLCDSTIDGNWVLKHKRKRSKLAASLSKEKEGLSLALASTRNNGSIKKKPKHDVDISRFANKIKGRDGYYYECVECDLGGNLLCCDSCPRTYHLECLNPPLKRAPPGNWQCPRCCEEKDSTKLLGNADASSKRARTKRVFKNTTSEKLSVPSKVSFYSRSSIQEKSESKDKGKLSCDGGSRDEDLSSTDNEHEKKTVSLLRLKKRSAKEFSTNTKPLKSGFLEKSLEERPEKHESALKVKKHVRPLDLSTQKSKKKKQKVSGLDSNRSGTKKIKHVAADIYSGSSTEVSPCKDYSESLQKGKSSNRKNSPSVAKEGKKKVKSVEKRHAKFAAPTLEGISEQGLAGDKRMTPQEDLQVDRILGCRLQTSRIVSPSHAASEQFESRSSARLEGERPSSDCGIPQTSCTIPNNCHEGKQYSGAKDINGAMGEECPSQAEKHGGKKQSDGVVVHEVYNGKSQPNKDSLNKDKIMTVVSESSSDRAFIGKSAELVQGDAPTAINVGDGSVNYFSEESKDLEVSTSKTDATMGTKQDGTPESRIHAKVEGIAGKDHDGTVYEFLVKWLGKSNIHNTWVSEAELKILAKRKLENYKAKYGTSLINICKEQWSQPQRIIGLRASLDGTEECLVKWCSLPYDECTWERLDEPVMEKTVHLVTQLKNFESQALNKDVGDGYANTRSDCQELNSLVEQPKELQGGTLFPHQLEALNWLRKCWCRSKNVILADEMGLGKTVSACAFISSLCCEFKVRLPCLVLVPLSTMPNWLAEFASWAPHLNVVEYHGSARARSIIRQYEWHASDASQPGKSTKSYKFNVLLTTYEMVLADAAHLRSVSWELLIVDEGHRLKNSSSKLFSLLNAFSFQHRVLLTGTPLQNNIGEMYNLLNFLQPASFPSLASFEEKFNDLTTAEKVEELKKLVAPHMLRRLKKDAMQNIPPKTERMVPVELTSIQAEYYRAMLTKNYQLLRNIGKGGAHQSLLNIVMQLRKVCNHPYLIPGTEPESGSLEFLHEMRIKASAKLTLLHSMLKILHKDGHRILIFSQMTKLLDILEDYLTVQFGPKTFERVDGSVSVADRQAAIARFNQDKTRFVFLLSTRSCGLGINLATADTVIIYDSDFNPHADIQAMNRAHRIGQSNRLLVYRLVVRASVEERILQLAKKKLMLDQLFVNKSESQKEVEDILRWGTEELFRDSEGANGQDLKEPSAAKYDVTNVEFKHRRRTGGLGDVYEDKCAAGTTKLVWDENAIMKLLDRSNLPSSISESTDGDVENDMLGTVKSIDWNDELNDEPGIIEDLPGIAGDGSEQASEPKQDNATNGAEENEWDKLLRIRWEKYQVEEEASLGRGKRLRKAVSYRETFAAIPSEALSESSDEEDEPKREYTPAGRAFKEKYTKLRARQKERIAQRHNTKISADDGIEEFVQPRASNVQGHGLDSETNTDEARIQDSYSNQEDAKFAQAFGTKYLSEPPAEMRQPSRQGHKRYPEGHKDLSAKSPGITSLNLYSSKHQSQVTPVSSSTTSSNLLPVLGLCAPNADQVNSYRNSHSALSMKEQRRTSSDTADIPSSAPIADHSIEPNNEGQTTGQRSLLPESSEETLWRLKNIIPDSYFPFHPIPPSSSSGKGLYGSVENPGSSFASFQEKLGLPNLSLDDNIPFKNTKPLPDFFPSLSLSTNKEYTSNPIPEVPNIPLLPNFMHNMTDALKQKQHMAALPPMLGLNQVQATYSPMPENHKKVLDSIMMRTQYATSKLLKKRSKPDAWSEDELDALWIGVRRHGRGNWDTMLRDPKLKFSSHRTAEELDLRWAEEQRKILEEPVSAAPRSSKRASFPGISDGMMTRALHGSKFSRLRMEPPKFYSHLTDIQLGCSNLIPGFPHVEPAHYMNPSDSGPSLTSWQDYKHRSSYSGDFPGGAFDKLEKPDIGLIPPFLSNSSTRENLGLLLNSRNNNSTQQNEAGPSSRKNIFIPGVSDKQMNLFREMQSSLKSRENSMEINLNTKKHSASPPIENSSGAGSSKSNKLPHWLQEAVRGPPSKPPDPQLPPTVSAIAQSVRLLFGEEKPAIPPFQIPGPRLSRPKDPRGGRLKKRKLNKVRKVTSQMQHPENTFDQGDETAIPPAPPFMESPPGIPRVDHNDRFPSLNLNSPSSSSLASQGQNELSQSQHEEAHQSVACSAATDSCRSPVDETPEGSCQRTGLPTSDEMASRSGRSPVSDTPDPGCPVPGNVAIGSSRSPEIDMSATSGQITELPATGDHEDIKQDCRIGKMGIGEKQNTEKTNLGCSENLKEEATPLDVSRDLSVSCSDSIQINQIMVQEDTVEETAPDEHQT